MIREARMKRFEVIDTVVREISKARDEREELWDDALDALDDLLAVLDEHGIRHNALRLMAALEAVATTGFFKPQDDQ